jgi:hypothetical protein
MQTADATVGPFTIFAPKPQPVRRHHTRHRHRR